MHVSKTSPPFLKIHEILKDLLSRGSGVADSNVYNPLLCEIDCSKICELSSLDTSTLEIQRGQEDALSFFNRLLIGYGINYVFEFDEEKGVKLIFSCDETYQKNYRELNCTNDQYLAAKQHSYIYFTNDFQQKKSIQFDKARAFAKKLKNSWLNFEISRTDTKGTKAGQIKNIYKNLCIRKLEINPKLITKSVEDIRLIPGIVLNSYIDEINSKYLVANVTTDITAFSQNASENVVLLQTECLELVDHLAIAELDDKSDGDHFEFDSKKEFGSLVHQELANLLSLDSKQSLDIVEAMACAKDGSMDAELPADYAEDKAENNDLFYAIITNNNDNVISKVHTLIDSNSTSVKKIMQGQRILVMQKGGAYYLYGYVPQPVFIENDQRDSINQEIMSLNESSISLMTFKNNQEYIYSLLKKGARQVEDAVIVQALKSNDPGSHDITYVNTYNKQVVDLHNEYVASRENYQKALEALNAKYADGHVRLSKYYSGDKLNQDIPHELENVNNCKDTYNNVCEKLYALAGNIVTDCKIDFTDGEDTKDVLVYDNKDGYKFLSEAGDFNVSAKNITLNATTKISLNAPNIELKGSESVTSQVGFSTVTTTSESTNISTGATINGTIPNTDKGRKGQDASDLISSSFSVGTYSGIAGTAYNVRFTGNNLLTLTGPLKCGITLGYGAVRVVGSEFKVLTQGRFEQYRNILQATKTLAFDIIQSRGCLKNNMAFQLISAGIDDVGTAFDTGVGSLGMLPIGYGNLKRGTKNARALKYGKKGRKNDPLTRGEKVRAVFDILDSIMQTLFRLADWIMVILKRVMKYQEIVYNKKKEDDEKYQKYTLMTPFEGNDAIKRLDQVELYISYIKFSWNILAAGFKASQSAYGFIPSVSEFSVNSTKAELKAQTITFTHHKEAERACAPAQGSVEHTLREQMTTEKSDDAQAVQKNITLNFNDEDELNEMDGIGHDGAGKFKAQDKNKKDIRDIDHKQRIDSFDQDDFDKYFGEDKAAKKSDEVNNILNDQSIDSNDTLINNKNLVNNKNLINDYVDRFDSQSSFEKRVKKLDEEDIIIRSPREYRKYWEDKQDAWDRLKKEQDRNLDDSDTLN